MNKYICKEAKINGSQLITCKACANEVCKYQKYCPTDRKWYNSDLYKQCEHLDKE